MERYIYQSPRECQRALRLIQENVTGEATINALEIAINYLGILQMHCDADKERLDRENEEHRKKWEIKENKRKPIGIGDVVKCKDEEDDETALQWVVARITGNRVEGICYDGACYDNLELDKLVKTGKNYSEQLAGLLTEMCADMRGDEKLPF